MLVNDILKRKKGGQKVYTVNADASLAQAIDLMTEHRIGAVVVTGNDKIAGIVSERDVIHALSTRGAEALTQPVTTFMTENMYICEPDDEVKAAMNWFTKYRVRHLPVVEGGELRGLISIGDAVKHRLEEVETEARILRDITLAR